MLLKMSGPPQIDNLRDHPPEDVARLRSLLIAGTPASPDPRRRNFYEVEDGDRAFYIHVSPAGRVYLLAIWLTASAHLACLQKTLAEAVACCR